MKEMQMSKVPEKYFNVGFIQTNLDEDVSWYDINTHKWKLPMSASTEALMNSEIEKGFRDVVNYTEKPHMIVLPEVTIPLGLQNKLERLCKSSRCIVVAGLDFIVTPSGVQNKMVVMVPNKWPADNKSKYVNKYYTGKTYFSESEKRMFNDLGKSECPDQNMYIFHAGNFGSIGVAICSDFFDIERFVIYKGKIQHMIVISHNKDTESYYFLAEAISRLVFCNVVICNTGYYGDSIAFSPYKESFDRYIYRHKGKQLFATQVVSLPVDSLISAQKTKTSSLFKTAPPGFMYHPSNPGSETFREERIRRE